MPLLDHFHAPWKRQRPWEGFHSVWANALAQRLNHGLLPASYVAIPHVKLGGSIEVDVATINGEGAGPAGNATTATATALWAPPRPALDEAIDFADLDTFEVQVLRDDDSPALVAAIELVSPATKDRLSHRQAFAVKCANYLQQGVGLLMVDVVTSRSGDFHAELMRLLRPTVPLEVGGGPELYASAYRIAHVDEATRLQAWTETLTVGAALPTMPLWISTERCIRVDLEDAYMTARDWLLMT